MVFVRNTKHADKVPDPRMETNEPEDVDDVESGELRPEEHGTAVGEPVASQVPFSRRILGAFFLTRRKRL